MQKHLRILLAIVLVVATLSLAGCPQRTTIAEINSDPGRFRDKQVALEGRVVTSFGLGAEGAYELDDGTGRIWVFSKSGGVPSQDARVRVAGRVQSGLTFGGRTFGTVIRESQRRSEAPR
jgi:hypothetical protein